MKRVLQVRSALIVAPHPDDEAIAAWGLMRALRRRGARVRILVVSDGAASHPRSRRWPPARLAAERRRETLRAAAALAIGRGDVRFLSLPDGGLTAGGSRTARAIGGAIRRSSPPALIVGPAVDDDHADHRAVAQALAGLPRHGERRLTYRVWGGRVPVRWRLVLDPAAVAQKRRALMRYRTQAGAIDDATAGFAMTWRHLRRFAGPCERFA